MTEESGAFDNELESLLHVGEVEYVPVDARKQIECFARSRTIAHQLKVYRTLESLTSNKPTYVGVHELHDVDDELAHFRYAVCGEALALLLSLPIARGILGEKQYQKLSSS